MRLRQAKPFFRHPNCRDAISFDEVLAFCMAQTLTLFEHECKTFAWTDRDSVETLIRWAG